MDAVLESDAKKSLPSHVANEPTCTKDVENKPAAKSGLARIKPEYIIKKEEKVEIGALKDAALSNAEEQGSSESRPRRNRGMNRGRDQAMAKARHDVQEKVIRLCRSIVQPGVSCKFGEKCNALHSAREYWEKRSPDIGDVCTIYEQFGTCNFGLTCRYANAHTNPETLAQLTKESNPDAKLVMNSQHMQLLQKMRKKQFDFGLADSVVKNLPNTGALCRENLKIDMNSLNGKRYLAPLTTVGNLPFRRLCVDLGAEITCGEMAMGTGLLQGLATEWSLMKRHPCEKIFGVQLAGGFPDSMARATQLVVEECEVDFIDLNLGCPLDAVNDKCGGCALANRLGRCIDVLKSMNLVAGDVPITTKMRYGMHQGTRTAHYLMKRLVEAGVTQSITLHPRSREQRYTNLAEWDYVSQCVEAINKHCPFWTCGDVLSYEDYYNRLDTPGVNGVMIARGALIKPWIFTEIEERRHWDISASERLDLIRKFTNYGLENWGSDHCGVENTRRFLLEWLSFQCRYIPVGILEVLPQKINERPPFYVGRNEMETLLSSPKSSDWVKITEMFLGKTPDGFLFIPKHNASAY